MSASAGSKKLHQDNKAHTTICASNNVATTCWHANLTSDYSDATQNFRPKYLLAATIPVHGHGAIMTQSFMLKAVVIGELRASSNILLCKDSHPGCTCIT